MPKSSAERQAAYRARLRAEGKKPHPGTSGKSNYKNTKWDNGQFIALDGEGESVGKVEKFSVGTSGKTYAAKAHHYTLLAASSGESLYNGGKRLDTIDCINFLLDLGIEYPKGIFVIFAGGYDINHILMFGFEREKLQRIGRGETVEFESDGIKYCIEYRARKSLMLRRGLDWKVDSKTEKYKPVWKDKIVIWDVFGFFQESFVAVMKKWLGDKHRHFELIKRMKLLRGDFAKVPQKDINAYNAAELEVLVEIMNKVRAAITGLDLKCNRWDGAGAVAAALMRKHDVRNFKEVTPDNIIDAVRRAYAGGRIEVCKIGNHVGKVYDYDINSAYPSVMADMPCMLHGRWTRLGKCNHHNLYKFSICNVRWKFPEDQPFYPFFYRTEKMQISFPSQGEGWYWWPEIEAAFQHYPEYIEIIEQLIWVQECNHKPFHWIPDYYKTRQQWVKHPTEDWHNGAEKIIKLGLNSLYGKTAQQIGGKLKKAPTYHQLEWAGYITSATRARLYLAAMCDPSSVIGFATDGIFTTKPLSLDCSTKKEIGAWELKEPVPEGMTIAMAGVYWWHFDKNNYGHFSRGFDKDSMKTPDKILNAWKAGESGIDIPMHRLIGIGSACTSETLWKMRGRFTEGYRTLRLDGKSHKRQGIDVKKTKPHLNLVDLEPSLNIEYGYGLQGCSHPYPISWIENPDNDDYENDLELQREVEDTTNI